MFTVVSNVFFEFLLYRRHFRDSYSWSDMEAFCITGSKSTNKTQDSINTGKQTESMFDNSLTVQELPAWNLKYKPLRFTVHEVTFPRPKNPLPVINSCLASLASCRSHFDFIYESFITRFLSVLARNQPLGCIICLLQRIWMGTHERHATKIHNWNILVGTALIAKSRYNSTLTKDQGTLLVRFTFLFLVLPILQSLFKAIFATVFCTSNRNQIGDKELVGFTVNDS
jgi:hypothetical protein